MPAPQDMQAEQDAFSAQYDQQQAAKAQQEKEAGQPPSFLQKWVTGPIGRVSTQMVDGAVSAADQMYDSPEMRKSRDGVAGAITGATNMVDAGVSAVKSAAHGLSEAGVPTEDGPQVTPDATPPTSPIWDHAKASILDFRDAVAVQDPTLADNVRQSVAQLALPFAGYSRALAGVHGIANTFLAGGLTDATALAPHDGRLADLYALGRHTEGRLGEALRTLAPDGSALNAYVNFLSDRGDESEAEGRFKNVLDGFGANLITTPLMHSAGMILKQGQGALRYAAENFGDNPLPASPRVEPTVGVLPKPAAGPALSPNELAAHEILRNEALNRVGEN